LILHQGLGSVFWRHWLLTRLQGVSSLSLNSGTIHLAFEPIVPFLRRKLVVGMDDSSALVVLNPPWITYTLPYLFQSLDTTTGPNKLAVCEPALVSALQYTDIGGEKGSHPNFPPFPLCRSLGQAVSPAATFFPKFPNPAQAPQGYSKRIEKTIESENDRSQVLFATWLSDWKGTITVPDTLVKTVSSGTMCCPFCIPCLQHDSFCLTFVCCAEMVIGPLTCCGLLICCPR